MFTMMLLLREINCWREGMFCMKFRLIVDSFWRSFISIRFSREIVTRLRVGLMKSLRLFLMKVIWCVIVS